MADPQETVRGYLLSKMTPWAASVRGAGFFGDPQAFIGDHALARVYLQRQGGHRNDLIAEIRQDMDLTWQGLCGSIHALSRDHLLNVVVDVLGFVMPADAPLAELLSDALLLACGTRSRWLERNGIGLAAGAVVAVVVTAIATGGNRD